MDSEIKTEKTIIIKFNNFQDAVIYYDSIKETLSDKNKKLLESYLNNDKYLKRMEIKKFILYLRALDNIEYKDDAIKIADDIKLQTENKSQLNTIDRIIRQKPEKEKNKNMRLLSKQCPHCGRQITKMSNETYIICGYSNPSKGFDWKGCGKDWCFVCGKKLCKSWNIDTLYDQQNRTHNTKCCKTFANKFKEDYKKDYCHCNNLHVNRND